MNKDQSISEFITVLTPETIPDFAKKTGRSEDDLMVGYAAAKAEGKEFLGFYMPEPWWLDEVKIVEEKRCDPYITQDGFDSGQALACDVHATFDKVMDEEDPSKQTYTVNLEHMTRLVKAHHTQFYGGK